MTFVGKRVPANVDELPLLGTTVNGRYRIEQAVAVGGFGVVYRAVHLPTGCDVAIKVLHDHLAYDAGILERFRREAETVKRLRAPNTVEVYELGEAENGALYIAMEWLRGEALIDRLERERVLPWRQAVSIARAVCAALSEAHAMGIVHRDLKPANIHLEPWGDGAPTAAGGFVKVLDFGIAKVVRKSGAIVAQGVEGGDELTQVGEVLGTLEYMAPEQIVGGTIDVRTDIYALGVVLYELVTGVRPFEHALEATSLIAAMLQEKPLPPSRYSSSGIECDEREPVPAELDAILARCLLPRRRDRFANVDELAAELDALERMAAEHDAAQAALRHAPAKRESFWNLAPVTMVVPAGSIGEENTWLAEEARTGPLRAVRVTDRSSMRVTVPARSVGAIGAVGAIVEVTPDAVATVDLGPVVRVPTPSRAARGSVMPLAAVDRAVLAAVTPRAIPEALVGAALGSIPPGAIAVPPRTSNSGRAARATLMGPHVSALELPVLAPPRDAPSTQRTRPAVTRTDWAVVLVVAILASMAAIGATVAML